MIGMVTEITALSAELLDQISNDLNLDGKLPAGMIFHGEGPMEGGGMRVIDVWESQADLDVFFDRISQIGLRHGITLPQPVSWPLTQLLR